jgi:hypothetical protein
MNFGKRCYQKRTRVAAWCVLAIITVGCSRIEMGRGLSTQGQTPMDDEIQECIACLQREITDAADFDAEHNAKVIAADRLVELGRENAIIIADVIRCLRSHSIDARYYGCSILLRIGPAARDAIPELARRLEDQEEHEGVRSIASNALGFMGPAAIPVLGSLLAESQDPYVRKHAADALCRQQENPEDSVRALLKGLEDIDRGVRRASLSSLVHFGKPAVQLLQEALQGAKGGTRVYIAKALVVLDPACIRLVTPVLLEGLGLLDSDDRAQAGEAWTEIAEIHSNLEKVLDRGTIERLVTALKQHLQDRDSRVRRTSAATLGSCGSAAELLVPDLVHCASDEDWLVRGWAIRSLGRIKRPAKPIVAALTQALSDEESEVQGAAADALADLGIDAIGALHRLEEALHRHKGDEEMTARLRGAIFRIRRLKRSF